MRPWRLAARVAAAASFATLAVGAQEAPARACPDAAPLYAARDATTRAWTRLLRLRAPRLSAREREDEFFRRFWEVRLARVWPRGASWCAYGAVEATLREEGMGYRNGPVAVETVRVLVEANERGGLVVTRRNLAEADWRFVADPAVPDLDADGVPESLVEQSRSGDASSHCAQEAPGECGACGLPYGQSVVVQGSRGAALHAPFFSGGRPHAGPEEARYQRLLEELPRGEYDAVTRCPGDQPLWTLESRRSPMMVRQEGGAIVAAWSLLARRCAGWEADPERSQSQPCDDGSVRVRTVRIEGGSLGMSEREGAPDLTVRCDATPCSLTAVPWRLVDGDRAPHPLPVTLTAAERAQAVGTASADGATLLLPAGYFAVEARGERGTRVWLVTLDPSRTEPVVVAP